jgi:uncharacterized delta-60 repeat protein
MRKSSRLRVLPLTFSSLLLGAWLPACGGTDDSGEVDGGAGDQNDGEGSGGRRGSGGSKSGGSKSGGAGPGAGGSSSSSGGRASSGGADPMGGEGGVAGEPQTSGGGPVVTSGGSDAGVGGNESSGGSEASGGNESTGGSESSGGAASGGSESSGGAASGGSESSGGASSGGSGSGGAGQGGPLAIERGLEVTLSNVRDIRGLGYAANGSLYASGYRLDALGDAWFALLRILPNGQLDPNFGSAGMVEYNLSERDTTVVGETVPVPPATAGNPIVANTGAESSYGVVELENGDVVVQVNVAQSAQVGAATNPGTWVGLIRLDSEGDVVESFGNDGIVQVQFGQELGGPTAFNDNSWGLALDAVTTPSTEKLVVFGFGTARPDTGRTDNDRYVARILAEDGSPDPDFNSGESFSFHTTGTLSDGGRRGSVLPDGKILSSGYTNLGTGNGGNNIVLLQLSQDGTLDASFGFTGQPASNLLGTTTIPGVAVFNPFAVDGGVAECYGVALQSTGRLVTTGYGSATAATTASTLGYLTSVRQDIVSTGVLATGLDPAFGNSGHFVIQSEDTPPPANLTVALGERFEERGREVLALSDDRLVYAGRYDVKPALSIVRKNGGMDETVGDQLTGHFLYDSVRQDSGQFYSLAMSSDGTRVAAATDGWEATPGAGDYRVLVAFLQIGDQ